MTEAMPKCQPTLLEPILALKVGDPTEFTSKRPISGRRGQILGYEPHSDWQGWDEIRAYLPQTEMHNFIIELRSLTIGVGFFNWKYDHLQEVPAQVAESVLATINAE